MISFACIAPHPPIILPDVGSDTDRKLAAGTIKNLEVLGKKLERILPDMIVVSSPHPDWGFKVPLFFLAKNIKPEFEPFLAQEDSPEEHYRVGKDFYFAELKGKKEKIALIASGDLSHRLKTNGPYGLHPDGAKFDNALIEGLKTKCVHDILRLNDSYPEAGECGLRSFCFALGILDAARVNWKADILSYEAPFGVGYLVCDLMTNK